MYTRILVPLDGSELAEQAIGTAAAIARVTGAVLDLVLAEEPTPVGAFADIPWAAGLSGLPYLREIARELEVGANVRAAPFLVRGQPVPAILGHAAQAVGVDLIVMTSHGRTGLRRAVMGSVADGVVRASGVPVLMLSPHESDTASRRPSPLFRRMLVTLDGSPRAMEILTPAAALARVMGAEVSLLRVVPPIAVMMTAADPIVGPLVQTDRDATDAVVEEWRGVQRDIAKQLSDEGVGMVGNHVVVGEDIPREIDTFASTQGIDLIAMATHGRGLSRLVLGSVTDGVRRATRLPMLIYRPLGHHTLRDDLLSGEKGVAVG
jgi:nucleotide-binding universal stress UspA family protein